MRILFLSQWFYPEPFFKGLPFAQELMRRGHTVEVLTGFPNYPGGKIYKGYKIRFFQRETIDGISVIRVPLFPSHDRNGFFRILNYLSFALSAAVLGPFLIRRADSMYVYHPPITVGFPAIVISILKRIPYIYDVQDLWPDTLRATGMISNQTILGIVNVWCNFVYRMAHTVTVLSNGYKNVLVKRGVPQNKIEVIYNWCDESGKSSDHYCGTSNAIPAMNGRFNIVFAGTMGIAQALDAVLDAAVIVQKKTPQLQFVFVGDGVDVGNLKKKASALSLENVLFLPKRPVSEMGVIFQAAQVLLVHLKNDPLFEITIPSKTQAYMAFGRPIMMAVHGDAAALVKVAEAGISCTPQDPQSIADTCELFYTMPASELERMSENGKKFYRQNLSLAIGAGQFETIFNSACL